MSIAVLGYNISTMKSGLEEQIRSISDPKMRDLLAKMRHEYRDMTSPLSIAMGLSIVVFWVIVVGGLIFFASKFSSTLAVWFLSLSGGFTQLGVISLVVGVVGLLSVPAAYGYGRSRGKKKP